MVVAVATRTQLLPVRRWMVMRVRRVTATTIRRFATETRGVDRRAGRWETRGEIGENEGGESGAGAGDGAGDGLGSGEGPGLGDGDGLGPGDGLGSGDGDGDGSGLGSGDGSGSGLGVDGPV